MKAVGSDPGCDGLLGERRRVGPDEGVVPASAIEVAAGSDEPVSRAVTVAANEIRHAIPAHRSAAAPTPQRRPKTIRVLRAPPTRPVAHSDRTCSGGWCGRQFVLMLGIGF